MEAVPSMDVIHIFALKDDRIFDLNRKVEEMQKTLQEINKEFERFMQLTGSAWSELTTVESQAKIYNDRLEEMQKTLVRCLPYVEPEVTQEGYGFFPGGDPTKFHPDTENSLQEIENWQEACKRWKVTKEVEEGSHRWLTDGAGNVIGTATVANLGMGIYTYEDEEAKEIVEFIRALKGVPNDL